MKKSLLMVLSASLILASCSTTKNTVEPAEDTSKKSSYNKNFIGWVDGNTKDVVVQKGLIQIKAKPNLGTFTIGVCSDKNKIVPVLSSNNEFTSNTMYLKMSKKTYHVLADNSIRTSAVKNENGLTINYNSADSFEIVQNFTFLKSSEQAAEEDMLKVELKVTNRGSKKDDFSLKMIFDTVLGETGAYHFYTADGLPVKNEVMYRTMQNQKWIESKNNVADMQFMFYGADITSPEIVALANYSTLEKNNWEPDMLNYRSFDTVLSYNNSGLCAIWPSVKLSPKESKTFVYYLAFSTENSIPAGEKYIAEYTRQNGALKTLDIEAGLPAVNQPEMVEETAKSIPNVQFEVNGFSKYQYTQEYIQSLLDRIAYLESNTDTVNRQELLKLNEELDTILSSIR